jgi:hypothetical protein
VAETSIMGPADLKYSVIVLPPLLRRYDKYMCINVVRRLFVYQCQVDKSVSEGKKGLGCGAQGVLVYQYSKVTS